MSRLCKRRRFGTVLDVRCLQENKHSNEIADQESFLSCSRVYMRKFKWAAAAFLSRSKLNKCPFKFMVKKTPLTSEMLRFKIIIIADNSSF